MVITFKMLSYRFVDTSSKLSSLVPTSIRWYNEFFLLKILRFIGCKPAHIKGIIGESLITQFDLNFNLIATPDIFYSSNLCHPTSRQITFFLSSLHSNGSKNMKPPVSTLRLHSPLEPKKTTQNALAYNSICGKSRREKSKAMMIEWIIAEYSLAIEA